MGGITCTGGGPGSAGEGSADNEPRDEDTTRCYPVKCIPVRAAGERKRTQKRAYLLNTRSLQPPEEGSVQEHEETNCNENTAQHHHDRTVQE